jgi:hypothetical protein
MTATIPVKSLLAALVPANGETDLTLGPTTSPNAATISPDARLNSCFVYQ